MQDGEEHQSALSRFLNKRSTGPFKPELKPIPTTPFDLSELQRIQRRLDLHVRVEMAEGRYRANSGLCAIGILAVDPETKGHVFSYEASVFPRVCCDKHQPDNSFWTNPEHAGAWVRMVSSRRTADKVARELCDIITELRRLGWIPVLHCRPASFETCALGTFFDSIPLTHQIHCERQEVAETTGGSDELMENPFDSTHMDVVCIDQRIKGISDALGVQTGYFELMRKVIGRNSLTFGVLQDTRDQADVWYAVQNALRDPQRMEKLTGLFT